MNLLALIVEDEPALQILYKTVLKRRDYQVATASTGQEAIDYLQQNSVPHLIMLDICLPEITGLDVLDFLAANADRFGTTHVVLATAGQEYEIDAQRVSSSSFLLKPVMPQQVQQIADQVRAQMAQV